MDAAGISYICNSTVDVLPVAALCRNTVSPSGDSCLRKFTDSSVHTTTFRVQVNRYLDRCSSSNDTQNSERDVILK